MVPTKRLIRSIFLIAIGLVALIGLIEGLWIFKASPLTILIVELSIIGAGTIGALIGWLVLRAIYPHLRSDGKNPAVEEKTQVSTVKGMSVEYELNIDSVLAFHLYNREHSPQLRPVRKLIRYSLLFVSIIEIIVAIVLIITIGEDMLLFSVVLSILAILTFIYFILYHLLTRKVLKWSLAKSYSQGKNKLVGKHRLSITPDAANDITALGESTTRWDSIEYVESTEQYLFMSIRSSSPYIVPRRAFSDERSFRQFVEAAKAYHRAEAG